jgi:hypothetical protein
MLSEIQIEVLAAVRMQRCLYYAPEVDSCQTEEPSDGLALCHEAIEASP